MDHRPSYQGWERFKPLLIRLGVVDAWRIVKLLNLDKPKRTTLGELEWFKVTK